MIKSVFNFSNKKSLKQAILFYIAWIAIFIIIEIAVLPVKGLITSALINLNSKLSFMVAYLGGYINLLTAFLCIFIAFLIVIKKKLESKKAIMLFLLTLLLSFDFFGPVIGFIPVAILSTIEPNITD